MQHAYERALVQRVGTGEDRDALVQRNTDEEGQPSQNPGEPQPLLRLAGIDPGKLPAATVRRLEQLLAAVMSAEGAAQNPDVSADLLASLADVNIRVNTIEQRGGRHDTLTTLLQVVEVSIGDDTLTALLRYDVENSRLNTRIHYQIDQESDSIEGEKYIEPLVRDDIIVTPLSGYHLFVPDLGKSDALGSIRIPPELPGLAAPAAPSGQSAPDAAAAGSQENSSGLDQLKALNDWMESSLDQAWSALKAKADTQWDQLEADYDDLLDAIRQNGGVPGEYAATYLDFERDFAKGFVQAGYETVSGLVTLAYNAGQLMSASTWILSPEQNLARLGTLESVVAMLSTAKGWGLVWDEFKRPFVESWQAGDYGEAIGRGGFEIVDLILGSKGGTKVGKLSMFGKLGKGSAKFGTLGKLGTNSVKHLGARLSARAKQLGTTLRGWLDRVLGRSGKKPPPGPPSKFPRRPKALPPATLSQNANVLYTKLMSRGARASFPRYANMLAIHGIATPDDIARVIEQLTGTLKKTPPDLDELSKAVKKAFEPEVLRHLREPLPDADSYARMRTMTDGLHSKDKGSLVEAWYQARHAPKATREVWVSAADMAKQGAALSNKKGRKIDLFEGGKITEVKSGKGKLGPGEKAQFDDYRKMLKTTIPVDGKRVTVTSLRYTFTNPDGALANLAWMRRQLARRSDLEFHVFRATGESAVIDSVKKLNNWFR